MTIEEQYELYQNWLKDYEIDLDKTVIHDEMTTKDMAKLEMLDKKNLVWTQHGTCEDEVISGGFKIFGECQLTGQESSGCGCYQSQVYYVAKVPHDGDDDHYNYIPVSAYLPCPVCNPDGEGEGDPDCEGPEVPEGVDMADGCDEGFFQCYWD